MQIKELHASGLQTSSTKRIRNLWKSFTSDAPSLRDVRGMLLTRGEERGGRRGREDGLPPARRRVFNISGDEWRQPGWRVEGVPWNGRERQEIDALFVYWSDLRTSAPPLLLPLPPPPLSLHEKVRAASPEKETGEGGAALFLLPKSSQRRTSSCGGQTSACRFLLLFKPQRRKRRKKERRPLLHSSKRRGEKLLLEQRGQPI